MTVSDGVPIIPLPASLIEVSCADQRALRFHVLNGAGNRLAEINCSDHETHEDFRLTAEEGTTCLFRELTCRRARHWLESKPGQVVVRFATVADNPAGCASLHVRKWGGWLETGRWHELLASNGEFVGRVEGGIYSSSGALICRPEFTTPAPRYNKLVKLLPKAENQLDSRLLLLWLADTYGDWNAVTG